MAERTLMDHQVLDASFLAARKFAGCFNGMGTGKTLTALEASRMVLDEIDLDERKLSLLVIAPPIALTMWKREIEDWLGLPAAVVRKGADVKKTLHNTDIKAVVLSYDLARKYALLLRDQGTHVLICDESHALKSVEAKRTKAILGRGGIVECADYAWMLTGTPMTRHADDLFPFLVRAKNRELAKAIGGMSLEKYMLRYCVTQQREFRSRYGKTFVKRLVVGSRNVEELAHMVYGAEPVATRRDLEEVMASVPELIETSYYVDLELDRETRKMLAEINKMSLAEIEEALVANEASLSSVRRLLGTAKVKHAAIELTDRMQASDEPILVGCWHTDVINGLHAYLTDKGLNVRIVDGHTSAAKKDEAEKLFNARQIDGIIGQISAMGVSINLQDGGNKIVVVEEDWSPAIMDQFFARLRRFGQQKSTVVVDYFKAEHKIDEAVTRLAHNKARVHHKFKHHVEEA